MRKLKLPHISFKKIKGRFNTGAHQFSVDIFRHIFDKIDQLGIKKGVDQLGLDKFINQCAFLAAGSGVITGVGGISTIAVGVPLDMANVIAQQFRVNLAVTYSKTGNYQMRFDEFFAMLTDSLKGNTGITVTKKAMEEVAEKLMLNMGAKTTSRLVPIVGAVIGGSANYLFIKRVAASLKAET
ncbi:hypothetical protein H8S90_22080 [Olivibacter sp. SDN3]|uniref:hypothetical protein n=1 Tax=Olivibacter sp. SDN3 TaxID=2764720 RepID=UPI0016517C2A|nr:hypothetical protein [Olivibacter sp. SDN3]QNL49385.1 hypothetical protein H8S90_22080 [Olivibacter sp. SDN3]